jgi:DNA-binding transcriptional LysR family regulator
LDLRDEPFILWPRTASPLFHDQVVTYCRRAGFEPRISMEGSDIETQLGLVSAGTGVSPQPASFANLRRHGVVFRPLADPPESIIQLAWRETSPPQHLKTVIETARAATEDKLCPSGAASGWLTRQPSDAVHISERCDRPCAGDVVAS